MRIHGLIYRITYFNLCIMGVEVPCSEDLKRSCISCSGSLHSKDYKVKTLILCRRRWFMCLCCSLSTRLRNGMQHLCGRHRAAAGRWQPRGSCPWGGDPGLRFGAFLALPPAGGSIFLFYGMWCQCPASQCHWESENLNQELPTPVLRSTFCFSTSKREAGLVWHLSDSLVLWPFALNMAFSFGFGSVFLHVF